MFFSRRSFTSLLAFGVYVLCACAFAQEASPAKPSERAAPPEFAEDWQVIFVGKSRVGYARSVTEPRTIQGQTVVHSEVEASLVLVRFGQTVKSRSITRTDETLDGALLSFDYESQNPPAAATRTSGRVKGDKVFLRSEVNGKVTERESAWDAAIKSPAYQERLLRAHPMQAGEKLSLKSFDPQMNKVNTISIEAVGMEKVKLLDGSVQELLKLKMTHSILPLVTMLEFVDKTGTSQKMTMSLLDMSFYKVSKDVALEALSGEEIDLGISTLIPVPPIPDARTTKRVVYRLSVPGDDPSTLIPSGPTQAVRKIGAGVADLTVTAIAPPKAAKAIPEEISRTYLVPTEYLQSKDARVVAHAKQAAGTETDPWKTSLLMERWVYENLKKKNFSTLLASAGEVAETLSGDCTEHAVLLAAMARARGIPARTAIGLVYVGTPPSFGGHMWTEVYINGTWIPLDATLGRGGIGADHIKLADSAMADDGAAPVKDFLPIINILGKTKIEVREAAQ